MSTSKIEIQDGSGNVYYPKTSIDSVIYSDNTYIEEKIQMLETKLNELKSQLANSINNKTGSSLTSNSTVDEMAAIINSIKTLEQATADANATASNILVDKTAYVNGTKVTGTMPEKGAFAQTLSANGTINLGSGHYDSIKITQSLNTRGTTVWRPSTRAQSIPSGTYLTGTQTIEGDTNLAPQNIRAGVSIFGVGGALSVQSLGGYTKPDIQNRGIITRYKVVKQSETPLNLNGKSNNMYVVLQNKTYYVRDSGNRYCEVFCIDNNLNNLIFLESSGTVSTKYNKDYYEFLQYVNLNTFTTTSYESDTYLPYDQVGQGKKYHLIPLEGNTKYGKLVVDQHRTNGDSSNNSWCETSTIRLQTKVLTYDLLTLDHYGWLFNYSSSSDTFTTIVNRREGSKNVQYKTVYKIVPEVVDKDGNVIS